MLLSHWALLGFVVWTLLLLILGIGLTRITAIVTGHARPSSFRADVVHGTERYQRTVRAHMNCVETLPLFASLVWLGSTLGVSEAAFQLAAILVLPARVGQSIAHVASGRERAVLVRFTFFVIQLACLFVMIALLARRGLTSR